MSARSGEKMATGKKPGPKMLSGVEGPLPGDVHKGMRAGAAHPDNAGLGKRGCKPVAEQRHLIRERHRVDRQISGWTCTSQRPGIRYPPLRSITFASPTFSASPLGRIARMR